MKTRWFLSLHALHRVCEMGLERADVIRALAQPEVTWSSGGRQVAALGSIAVVSIPNDNIVVTVLWRTQDRYERAA